MERRREIPGLDLGPRGIEGPQRPLRLVRGERHRAFEKRSGGGNAIRSIISPDASSTTREMTLTSVAELPVTWDS